MNLPPALAPWSAALSTLDAQPLVALGPLLRGLDSLIARHSAIDHSGEILDGYSGITSRGLPERILASEWALADEVPLEFLRRAAGNELLHTAPAYLAERRRGRVAVLVDTGPDQLGAGRLVQLAALIVLHRRAEARGVDLVVGVLGTKAGSWQGGDLAKVLPAWLKSRRSTEPTPDDVAEWTDSVPADDDLWLLTGPRLARKLPGRKHMLVSTESAWSALGAAAVQVSLAETTVTLALPDQNTAVRTLRGAAFRPAKKQIMTPAGMHDPLFSSNGPQLITRGRTDRELYSLHVPGKPRADVKVHRHELPGPVVAAAYLGGRLVTLIRVGAELHGHVIGKKLARLDRLVILAGEFDPEPGPLKPLYFADGNLLIRDLDRWWELSVDRGAATVNVFGVGTGPRFDRPNIARRIGNSMVVNGRPTPAGGEIIFGYDELWAWSRNGLEWTVHTRVYHTEIRVPEGCRVLGLQWLDNMPTLITLSASGLIVRAHTASKERTLTKWSSGTAPPALHPTRPLIAVQRGAGAIDVGNIRTGETVLSLRGEP
ncbi:hypothetical protein [Actinocrispum sp. NPDC049592]|uniref:hypothetical protein n=1 Tax=Actinocrispum sp. NPDC049592 TaxID=3154835 RepID=UPI00342A8DCF